MSGKFNDIDMQDWKELQFSECVNKISIKHKIKQKHYLKNGKYPIIDQGQNFISGYSNDELTINIKKPVIVFGDHTRCFKFVDFDFIAGADGIKILEPKEFFNEKLFYYFCLILDFPNKGYSRHYQYLAKTIMRIPPLEIQKEIAARLDFSFDKIEKGIKYLKLAKENIIEYKQSMLKYAFEGKLTKPSSSRYSAEAIHKNENPTNYGWETKTIGDIFLIERGGSPRPIKKFLTNDNNGINWIKIGDTKNTSKYIYSSSEKIKPEGKKYSRFVKVGELILSNSMSFGRPYIMKTTGCIHDGWVVLRNIKNIIYEEFAYYVLTSSKIYAEFSKLAVGSTVKNLSIDRIKKIKIPIPPIETQKEIVSILDKSFESADNMLKYVEDSLYKAELLKRALLRDAFNGKI
ncbi:restriction endonuclease subunit S [Brachyspira aalborgi]|uniref:restriction endonuclease subunit S n=1 Tax=Brachyspira aalborgi TaxID=29522 RepID=UPI00266C565F|nr:restriction endonuclease subunit S [Brachyspira aalborgi]